MAGGDIKLPDLVSQARIDTKGVDAGLNRVSSQLKGVGGVADATGGKFAGLNKVGTSAIDGLSTSLTSGLGPASGLAKDKIDSVGASALASGSMLKLGLAGGAAAAGLALATFAVGGIAGAKSLGEAQSKVNVVFRDSAGEIEKFASGSARSMGITKLATLEAAGTFGNLFSSLGLGLPKATEMSKGLVQLGVDLASFNDIDDPTVVFDKLRSGIVGEIEPLRALGVSFNAADVERKAFELGLVTAGGKADDAAKIQARYALILEKTALAQGDFARTSGSLANQTKTLTSQIDDLQTELGEVLVPVLSKLASVAIPVVSGISKVTDALGGLDSIAGAIGKGALSNRGLGALTGLLDLLPGKHKAAGDAADAQAGQDAALGAQMGATGAQAQGLTVDLEAQAKAIDKVILATLSSVGSNLTYEASLNRLRDNINDLDDKTEDYTEAVNRNGPASKEAEAANRALRDAHLGIRESALRAAEAALKLADDEAIAAGAALTAEQRHQFLKQKLEELAGEASGPTRQAILDLSGSIRNVPDRHVVVTADTSQANRAISITKGNILDLIATASSPGVAGALAGVNVGARAHGGPVRAGMPYVVGEYRPELFVPEVNGFILPRVPSAAGGSPAGPGVVIYQTINPSEGMDERDIGIIASREAAWAAGR